MLHHLTTGGHCNKQKQGKIKTVKRFLFEKKSCNIVCNVMCSVSLDCVFSVARCLCITGLGLRDLRLQGSGSGKSHCCGWSLRPRRPLGNGVSCRNNVIANTDCLSQRKDGVIWTCVRCHGQMCVCVCVCAHMPVHSLTSTLPWWKSVDPL